MKSGVGVVALMEKYAVRSAPWYPDVTEYWYFQLCLPAPENASASQYPGQVNVTSLLRFHARCF